LVKLSILNFYHESAFLGKTRALKFLDNGVFLIYFLRENKEKEYVKIALAGGINTLLRLMEYFVHVSC